MSGAYLRHKSARFFTFGGDGNTRDTIYAPKIVKGKRPDNDIKGVQRVRMEAEQNWHVEFFFHNPQTGKMERFHKTALGGGWNPLDEQANEKSKARLFRLCSKKQKLV